MKLIKKTIRFYPYLISGVLIYLLFSKLDQYNFLEHIGQLGFGVAAVSLVMFIGVKALNTARYSFVYNIKKSGLLFWILCFCNFMLTLIPFQLGEYSYVKYFREKFGVNRMKGANKLILIRVFDYAAVYLLFLLSSFFVVAEVKNKIIFYISLATIAGLVAGAVGLFVVNKFKNSKRLRNWRLTGKFIEFFSITKKEFTENSKKTFAALFFYSLIYWLSRLVFGYVIFLMLGLKIGLGLFIFVSLLLLLVNLLPIKTFANFGIFEGGWAYFLVSVGYEYNDVLPTIVNYHILMLLPVFVYGFLGLLYIKKAERKKAIE
ncbi:MAG: lysylphosphatidylglycerol synthase transmembrane domain-containing protein [Candidatus Moranbacteria bacterium]|nr:lysylphosphatidylglycerol synthase transmembrane domain-containing protein [Candidatus Moranbacteria bacterium]